MNLSLYNYLNSISFTAGLIFIQCFNLPCNLVLAQVTPDNTLGNESSQVTSTSDRQQIDGGAIRGENLFHSFREFNVREAESVNFANPDGVTNIFSRVTGNNISQILGDLGVSGNANLFLMNPNGIVFGEKASLNVNGSFIATTANSINFADGNQFIANPAREKPLLTVNVPIGLQFGNQPGTIMNKAQSPQKALSSNEFNSNGNPAGLQIQRSNQTLALIGGEIILEGGNVTSLGSNIELASVGANSIVGLDTTQSGVDFNYQAVQNFSDITLTNREGFRLANDGTLSESLVPSTLDASSQETAGAIKLQGKNINIYNGSQILTPTQGNIAGGALTINAAEQLTISGNNLFRGGILRPSSLISSTIRDGNAGNITITTQRLVIEDSGQITSSSSESFNRITEEIIPATGDGGNITIVALESVNIANGSLIISNTVGSGKAGNINIQTGNLVIDNESAISVGSSGTGDAGNIDIQTQSLNITNNSEISAATLQSDGGNINLQIDYNLELRNQSDISASVGGNGNGGNIDIGTEFLITSPQDNSDITANAEFGQGGNISIEAAGIFGIALQDELTPFSDITVSSNLGTDGTVTLINSDTQLDRTESDAQVELVKVTPNLTPNYCYANRQNQYIQTGRGGVPLAAKSSLVSEHTWEDWRMIKTENSAELSPQNTASSENYIPSVNSIQGWMVNQQGEIVLTAEPIVVTPHLPKPKHPGC
ncbi:putative Filamentous hemagglutinin [Hyella patelloides LEGE 07179]|uniref:Putative Filamentous hemagglutinin n=1 Tax=Hyella patelloides LEGE 07179 TaxID=945734 RepID=A0A563VNZ2_9CYAN|nr:filamentous hemagglutinin N-terminal domain-containing protein [Hyella patelloides]VEP13140.1 putative Filamentous hemagglutinin [Hyella patelloides LEGE 07179]